VKRVALLLSMIFLNTPLLWGEEPRKAIEVFPTTPFYQYIIYENLAIFWIVILGMIIIIRMKLKEIERVQQMGLERNQHKATAVAPQDIEAIDTSDQGD
jgi:hypothetical protein